MGTAWTPTGAVEVLRRRWGHERFRPSQVAVLEAVRRGGDVLAVLPTGGGKSVCFQVPSLLEAGTTLVVSPLVALMQDQVQGALRRGLRAAAVTASTPAAERRAVARGVRGNGLDLLYVAPERLESRAFVDLWSACPPSRIAVDEAHCIAEWGHDFRPSYLRIGAFGERVGRPPVLALTATATPRTRAEIVGSLRLRRPALIVRPVDRPNLRFSVALAGSVDGGARYLLERVARVPGRAIVYVQTRRRAVRMAAALRRRGVGAAPYHAGLPDEARHAVQDAFLGGAVRVVCATNAFGMGVDCPDVRAVWHLGLPGSLEGYVQEAGRAGRDGAPSRCELVACRGDRTWQRERIRKAWPPARLVARVWRAAAAARPVRGGAAHGATRGGTPALAVEELARSLGRRGSGSVDPVEVRSAIRLIVESGAGRYGGAGRDDTSLVPGPRDARERIDFGACRRGRERAAARLAALCRYVESPACRRAAIARYFGDDPPTCAGCDRCDGD